MGLGCAIFFRRWGARVCVPDVGRSILFMTGMILRLASHARK
jgi:hypothetical protein